MSARRRRVLVIDDHPIVRLGIRHLLSSQQDLELCGEAGAAADGLSMAVATRPELALVDLSLVQGTGMDLIRQLREAVDGLQVLVISMHDESLYAERALRAGARGYIMKDAAIDGLTDAIRQVLAGSIYVSPRVSQGMLQRIAHEERGQAGALGALTDRELQVFELIGRGKSSADIAAQLGVSVKTIETYRANIRNKLNLKDGAELVRFAATWTARL